MSARYSVLVVALLAAVSIRCSGSPPSPVGSVSVTVTTTTTTTTTIPGVNAGAISAAPAGTGLAAATVYSFSFTTQPSGGVAPYTFVWAFGDGQEGAGPSPAHVYMNTGNFTASATVTDTTGKSARTSSAVSIRGVSGHWTAAFGAGPPNEPIDLVQTQSTVVATINDPTSGLGTGSGTVTNPRNLAATVTFATAVPPFAAAFVGQLDDALTTWTGTVTGFTGCPCTFKATRPSADAMSVRPTSVAR
jgi:hypothetical protein